MNYFLLTSEQIPNCCGSCINLRLMPTKEYNPPYCKLKGDGVCLFGLCDEFKRRSMFK